MKYDGKTKITKNLTFTLHYADGTSAEVDRGVLFSLDDNDLMDIHVGVSKEWELYGVFRCFMQFIEAQGLEDRFWDYVKKMEMTER